MSDFTITEPKSPLDQPIRYVYEGPFGPVELHQTRMPADLTLTLSGPNVPQSTLELGKPAWLPRRIIKSRKGAPFIAHVGNAEVTIRNERFFCIAGFGRNPTLGADTLGRHYTLPLKEFGTWRVKRSDGSVLAILRKKQWIDDQSEAIDVAIIVLLWKVGRIYDGLTYMGMNRGNIPQG